MTKNQITETVKDVSNQWVEQFMNNPFVIFVGKLFLAIVVVSILTIISKIIAWTVRKKIIKNSILDDEEYIDKIGTLVWDIVFYTLLLFSIFIWFEILWFDIGILLWWLSFWIWLAFKEILWNMIAGILILTTKDYTLWDIIKVEWPINYFWTIEEITIRYTIIREFNNQKVIIPNLTLITSPVKTFTTEEFIRLETIVSVHYNTDIAKAKKIILEWVNSLPFIINKENTTVITDKFNDSGIDLKVLFYIDPNWDTPWPVAISKVNDKIKKVLEENDINIPYPHTVLTVDKNDQNLLKTLLFLKK
jgi:small conductance mechanosensitive channel